MMSIKKFYVAKKDFLFHENCTHYKYQAIDIHGHKIKGESYFLSKSQLLKELNEKGYFLTKLKKIWFSTFFIKKIKEKQLAILCEQLSTLIKSGISVCTAISIIETQTEHKILKSILKHIEKNILKGSQLGNSLDYFRKYFPPIFIELIKIGEESGELQQVLINLSKYFEKISKTKSKLFSISMYPVIVLSTSICILLYLFTSLIPSFFQTISSLNVKIPATTSALIKISAFINSYFKPMILLSIVLYIFLKKSFHTKKGKLFKENMLLKVPLFRTLIIKYEISMICRGLSLLLKAGIPIIKALSIVKSLIRFECSKEDILLCIERLRRGGTVFESFQNTKFNNKLFLSMVLTGEEGGKLDELLEKTASIFEDDLNRTIGNILSFLEPTLILLLGGLVCFIVLSVINPMMNLIETIN